jgi:hypothetical protein
LFQAIFHTSWPCRSIRAAASVLLAVDATKETPHNHAGLCDRGFRNLKEPRTK